MLIKRSQGFTLIEVIVALSIFAVLSIVGYKAISSLIETKVRVEVEDNKWQELVLFFDRVEMDVKQSVNRPITTRNGSLESAWFGKPTYVGNDGAQLVFSRFGDSEQTGFLRDTRRVGYRLNEGAVELIIWPSLDAAPNSSPEVFKVLPHVDKLLFTYLTSDGRWLNIWPENVIVPQQKNFKPNALQLSITLDTGEFITRIFAL